uniref:E3 ubiquitin-protein ligase ARIH1-like UBA-like domain-containing protein n=1 Tax=Megaselia scalaris TaxID=36166 RepID=T1GHE6_MEGSC
MDSDEESFGKSDSGHNSPTDDEDDFPMEMDQPPVKEKAMETDEYPYETLTTESIVQTMIDCIDDVNSVLNLPKTTTRILLNHFKWDKEKLLERYFESNQEKFFRDAHVVNPFNKPKLKSKPKVPSSGLEECEICLSTFPPNV